MSSAGSRRPADLRRTSGQRRADALVEMATRSRVAPSNGRRPGAVVQRPGRLRAAPGAGVRARPGHGHHSGIASSLARRGAHRAGGLRAGAPRGGQRDRPAFHRARRVVPSSSVIASARTATAMSRRRRVRPTTSSPSPPVVRRSRRTVGCCAGTTIASATPAHRPTGDAACKCARPGSASMRRWYGDADVREGGRGEVARGVDRVGPRRLMPLFFTDDEIVVLRAACDRLIPEDETPGATSAGVPEYIDGLLGAFLVRPAPHLGRRADVGSTRRGGRLRPVPPVEPRSTSWRGGPASRDRRASPSASSTVPWRACRSGTGRGSPSLGADFCDLAPEDQDERLRSQRRLHRPALRALLRGDVRRPGVRGQSGRRGLGGDRVRR